MWAAAWCKLNITPPPKFPMIHKSIHQLSTMGDANDDVVHSARENMLVEDLLRNCHNLLHELEEFRTFLTQHKKEHTVEIRQFRNSVQSELKSLEKVPLPAPPISSSEINQVRSYQPQTQHPTVQSTRSVPRTSLSTPPSGPPRSAAAGSWLSIRGFIGIWTRRTKASEMGSSGGGVRWWIL